MTINLSEKPRYFRVLLRVLQSQASGGLLLMLCATLALMIANSPLANGYFRLLALDIGSLSLLHWINDGLMAIFFLLVGLEIKREVSVGELSSWSQRALPSFAALGGMVVPGLIYAALNWSSEDTLAGWAIPSATDIAFTLAVVRLLGSTIPLSLIVFLTALAILDDLGAVIIIALFYTQDLSLLWLAGAAGCVAALIALNWRGVAHPAAYLVLGCILWVCMLKSGIHATLAGVLLAMTIPINHEEETERAPHALLYRIEHALHPYVAYGIIPIFGFANAGVALDMITLDTLLAPVPLGVAAGLFLGKQIGIMLAIGLAVWLGLAVRPTGANWGQVYGAAILCGIGFTMSLFIGLLAFPHQLDHQNAVKIGVLVGSLLSALLGSFVLKISSRRCTIASQNTQEGN